MSLNNETHLKHVAALGAFAVLYGYLSYKVITAESILLLFALPAFFCTYYFFNKPVVCFWTILYSTMLAGIVVSYIPGMFNIRWGINLLAILLGISMLLKIFLHHSNIRFHWDSIFFLYSVFFIYGILLSIINSVPLKQLIIACKNNFQFYPVLLFFLIYPLHSKISSRLVKALWVIALIQPPIAIIQYLLVVPELKKMTGIKGASVLDAVNGTFGTGLSGGGTGTYTLFTCTILCCLMIVYNNKLINIKKFFILSIYFVVPMFLNETKAAVLFLLLGSFVAIALDNRVFGIKKILTIFFAVFIGASMIWGTLQMSRDYGVTPQKMIKQMTAYNLGKIGYGRYRLNRLSCLTFWWQTNKYTPVQLFIGHGLDSTIEEDSGLSTAGSVAGRYTLYGTGLTTASQMLWETGLAGFLLFLAIFFSSFMGCVRLIRSAILSTEDRLIAIGTAASLSLVIMLFFYNSSFRNSQPANMFITLLPGITILLKSQYQKKTA